MNQERNDELAAALDTTVYNLICPVGHRYTGYRMMVGTPCWENGCGKQLTISQPEEQNMGPIAGSSTAEHQALNLGAGGSNPPLRTEQHSSRESSKGRTAAFEAVNEGSTPSSRTLSPRQGWEMTLEDGTNFGWFEMPGDHHALTVNGQAVVSMSDEAWWTFLTWAYDHDPETCGDDDEDDQQEARLAEALNAQVATLQAQVRDLEARNDWQANTIRQMKAATPDADEGLRQALAEALQAVEEGTGVVEAQTAQIDRLEAYNHRLRSEVAHWRDMAVQHARDRDSYREQRDHAREDLSIMRTAMQAIQGVPPTLNASVERPE